MNKKLNNTIIILLAVFAGYYTCKHYSQENFGYIKRQSQVTDRRRRHQGWHESARSG